MGRITAMYCVGNFQCGVSDPVPYTTANTVERQLTISLFTFRQGKFLLPSLESPYMYCKMNSIKCQPSYYAIMIIYVTWEKENKIFYSNILFYFYATWHLSLQLINGEKTFQNVKLENICD
jgi:hypothetical protein